MPLIHFDVKAWARQIARPRISEQQRVPLTLVALLIIGAVLRVYAAGSLMRFTGDEARDVFLSRSIILQHARPLLGPKINLGYGFLGPAYAYLLSLPLWMGGFDPAVAAYLTAACDLCAILLMYLLGKELFGSVAGLLAAMLYTVSFTMVFYGRWGWHPSLIQGCTLFITYCMWKVYQGQLGYLAPLMGCMGLALQFHLSVALLFIPLALVIWKARKTLRAYALLSSLLAFVFVLTPLIYHELTTGFQNSREIVGILSFVSGGSLQPFLPYLFDAAQVVADQAFVGSSERVVLLEGWRWMYWINIGLFFASLIYTVFALRHERGRLYLLALWGIPILLTLAMYPGIRPHYYLLLWFPLPCLLVGALLGWLTTGRRRQWLAIGLMALLASTNLAAYASYLHWLQQGSYSYFYSAPLRDKERAIETVAAAAGGRSFDLSVVSWHWNNHVPYAYILAYKQIYPRTVHMFVLDMDTGAYALHYINTSAYLPRRATDLPAHQTFVIVEPASQKLPPELEEATLVADVGHVRIYRTANETIP